MKNHEEMNKEIARIDREFARAHHMTPDCPTDSRAPFWLEADIEGIAIKSDDPDKVIAEAKALIETSPCSDAINNLIDFEKMKRSIEVRINFAEALQSVEHGYELSGKVGYSFFAQDIKNLARLHKEGTCREKIEELLEDCNFHAECSKMARGNYEGIL